jgi:threonine dehydratase
MSLENLGLSDIYQARERIRGTAVHTQLMPSPSLSEKFGADVRLKLEMQQPIGAFKIRGAANKLASMSEAERARGVVTVSTGNHGRAVAYAAKMHGVRAVICMSTLVPENKKQAIARLGAEIKIHGKTQDEAEILANELVRDEGLIMVHPFDDPFVMCGQGTIGLELIEDMPEIEQVVVPLSGAGLLGGISMALKAIKPSIRTIGVSMQRGAVMIESLEAGKPIEVEELPTLADSLGGGIGLDNEYTFKAVQKYVDETIRVSEEEIEAGLRHLYFEEKVVAEGGSSVGIAAVLAGKLDLQGKATAFIISGNNIDMKKHASIMAKG